MPYFIDLISNKITYFTQPQEVIDLTVRRSKRIRKKPNRFNYDERVNA